MDNTINKNINNVLLANAFYLKNDPKQLLEKFKPYPPLAALYAASSLEEKQIKVTLFDATLSSSSDEFSRYLSNIQPDLLVICEDSFNFLSKMCLSHVRDATIAMIAITKKLKTANIPVVINSSDAADEPKIYLDAGADYVIVGEVEQSLVELVDWLNTKRESRNEQPTGLIYNTDGQWGRSNLRKNNRNLDNLPQPAWHLVNIEKYQLAWQRHHGYYSINMVTSRGCPYHCNWCAKPIWGQQYVCHSPEYIVKQIQKFSQFKQPDHIWFCDDIFGLKKGWVELFSQLMQAQNIRIPFMIQTRSDLLDASAVTSLKQAGCQQVWLGVESGSQSILDAMNKELKLEQVHEARQLLQQAGISTGFFIQLGYVNEGVDELQATRDMIVSLRPEEIGVSVSYPLPGTEFFNKVQNQLDNKTHWQDSNDLDTVFKSTFRADFYRLIRNHLHSELDALLANPNCSSTKVHWQQQWDQLILSVDQYHNRINATSVTI